MAAVRLFQQTLVRGEAMMSFLIYLIVLVIVATIAVLFVRWTGRWGSTVEERNSAMPGDAFLAGGPPVRAVMTRAVSIRARPDIVWPWLAQLGRGAGWYSYDWLDNRGRRSARHIVSWIPAPQVGDSSAIGYLRHITSEKALVWWARGVRFAGATSRLVVDIRLDPEDDHSRLVIRMSADAEGSMARLAILAFRFIDGIMARKQLISIRERAERHGARAADPLEPEHGVRDQYQLYETIYASGETAGVAGRELARHWRRTAIEDGVLVADDSRAM